MRQIAFMKDNGYLKTSQNKLFVQWCMFIRHARINSDPKYFCESFCGARFNIVRFISVESNLGDGFNLSSSCEFTKPVVVPSLGKFCHK